jgi:flagellar biosynthesis/type III secretory pathway protein FliH
VRAAEFVPLSELLTADAARADGAAVLRDVDTFRTRLQAVFDGALDRLLRDLATDVLGRELRLAPCDLASIVRRVRASAPVVRVRVAPGEDVDERALALGEATVVRDAALALGDAIVEVRAGTIDARLGVRLADVLAAKRATDRPDAG